MSFYRRLGNLRQFLLLATLLGLATAHLLWFTPKPPFKQWEPQIQAFENYDRTNAPLKQAVLVVGSSNVQRWESLRNDLQPHSVIRRGFGGAQIADVIAYADRIILPYKPRIVLVYAGDNDLAFGKTARRILADFRELERKIRVRYPETRVAFISIKPSIARAHLLGRVKRANALVKAYADRHELVGYIDVFTPMLDSNHQPNDQLLSVDGLHLNPKGYELWASIVRKHLSRFDLAAID